MAKVKKLGKLVFGIVISLVFMYLAFRKVDMSQMMESFRRADYWYIVPAVLIMFVSYWLRSFRWRYLMRPVKTIGTRRLFSSLLIGYMANSFLPAHLGEFVRAYTIGKKEDLPSSTVMASILIERIIDVLSLLAVMGLTVLVFPFPDWVKKSGFLFFAAALVLLACLVLLRIHRDKSLALIGKLTKPLPETIREKLLHVVRSLADGIEPLTKRNHYLKVFVLTALIWACYALSFWFVFHAFSFVVKYSLPWTASLVLLVLTTIGILVPSSPGYIGVYHFLCQAGLGFFGVVPGEALSYAFVMHGINFFPIIAVGGALALMNNLSIKNMNKAEMMQG